jgi:type I restriction enzyme S subunit
LSFDCGFDMVVTAFGCSSDFLQYALLSSYLKERQIDLAKTRAAQPHLNAEELGSCFVILPLATEQSAVVAFLDRETAKMDACSDRRSTGRRRAAHHLARGGS